jgi:hypothetical protein
LTLTDSDGNVSRFNFSRTDLTALIGALIQMASAGKRATKSAPESVETIDMTNLVPASSTGFGRGPNGETVLMVEVGALQLPFQVTKSGLVAMAQRILSEAENIPPDKTKISH